MLMVYAHPCEGSFAAAVRDAALGGLAKAGHDIDLCDLYAEGFDPVMSCAEREGYHNPGFDRAAVQSHIDRLIRAEALVLVSPVWNFGYPAIMKGYLDRVFLPRVTFSIVDGRVVAGPVRFRRIAAIHTYGAPVLAALLAGDPPRRFARRVLRRLFTPERPVTYLAHYAMNVSTPATRARFLGRVERAMERL